MQTCPSFGEALWQSGLRAYRWFGRGFPVYNSGHPTVNGYQTLFRAGEREGGEEEKWWYKLTLKQPLPQRPLMVMGQPFTRPCQDQGLFKKWHHSGFSYCVYHIAVVRGPVGRRSCIASYSLYPFNDLVTTWRHPSPLQVCVISQGSSPPWLVNQPGSRRVQWGALILPLSYHQKCHCWRWQLKSIGH